VKRRTFVIAPDAIRPQLRTVLENDLVPIRCLLVVSLLALLAGAATGIGAREARHHPAGTAFRDCRDCPAMVALPPGRFRMGALSAEPGRDPADPPRRLVTIGRPFAIGRYDVTRADYGRFVDTTGYAPANPRCDWRRPVAKGVALNQRPDEPVVCVNWSDARAYLRWLSMATGKPYRLPTAAEWEYAARAGSKTVRPWGEGIGRDRANYGAEICCGPAAVGKDRWLYTSPVGAFPPNAFGLYDMIGDVWQWTDTCGSGGQSGASDDRLRCVRGGGWFDPPSMLRSTAEAADDRELRVADIGFRVARSL
jgi:formylglycine-generating enzyme required for sulfatase activity